MRDGDRELEVSGSPLFVRQVLDELPALWAALHGEQPPSRRAAIRMPPPPQETGLTAVAADEPHR
jgi:hypothetical protein